MCMTPEEAAARQAEPENNVPGDSDRLEWMASREAWIAWGRNHGSCSVFVRSYDEDLIRPFSGWGSLSYPTAREAIDAAMESEHKGDRA